MNKSLETLLGLIYCWRFEFCFRFQISIHSRGEITEMVAVITARPEMCYETPRAEQISDCEKCKSGNLTTA
jgi:hypothetical protein